jgi:hypothetical protein
LDILLDSGSLRQWMILLKLLATLSHILLTRIPTLALLLLAGIPLLLQQMLLLLLHCKELLLSRLLLRMWTRAMRHTLMSHMRRWTHLARIGTWLRRWRAPLL